MEESKERGLSTDDSGNGREDEEGQGEQQKQGMEERRVITWKLILQFPRFRIEKLQESLEAIDVFVKILIHGEEFLF